MDYQYLITLVSVIAVISVLTFYVIPYLKQKNIVTDENMIDAAHVINIAKTIVKLVGVESKVLDKTTIILQSCELALKYTSDVMNVTDTDEKRKITFDAVVETLNRLGIDGEDVRNIDLIKMGINLAIVKSK